jgi:hypothetical protein
MSGHDPLSPSAPAPASAAHQNSGGIGELQARLNGH